MPQQYSDSFGDVVRRVRRAKPNLPHDLAYDFVNERIRTALDRRPYWSGTLKRGVLSIPAQVTGGTIAVTTGSAVVTGTDTAWPVSDVVNTTIPSGVRQVGMQTIVPASMQSITEDTVLYVDAAGTPEIVPVVEVTPTAFRASFAYPHNPNCTVTVSSLAGRQLRISSRYAIYTIRAITSATSAVLDNLWAGESLSGAGYSIVKMYYTLQPDVKCILMMADPQQPRPMRVHVQQAELNVMDPQRTQTGAPTCLADHSPNENGNMQYEVYPTPTEQRNLPYLYAAQWPRLRADGDRLPHFINPNVFVYGATASALRTKSPGPDGLDPYYDPRVADTWELMSERELLNAMQADESKAQMAYSAMAGHFGFGGADYAQSHAISLEDAGGEWW